VNSKDSWNVDINNDLDKCYPGHNPEFYYSALESFRHRLLDSGIKIEYSVKKKSTWPWSDLGDAI